MRRKIWIRIELQMKKEKIGIYYTVQDGHMIIIIKKNRVLYVSHTLVFFSHSIAISREFSSITS